MIQFPAVIKLTGQDELIYNADVADFTVNIQLQQAYLLADDLLIDATGQGYLLSDFSTNTQTQCAATAVFDLHQLTAMVQAHFFSEAQSCVTKIQAPSIAALFELLATSN